MKFLLRFAFLLTGALYGQSGSMEKQVHAEFKSNFVLPRRVDVYLPAGYPADAPYSVLYMHDGQNLSEPSTSTNQTPWKADSTMADLMQSARIPKTILVGIWNTSERYQEYAPEPAFLNISDELRGKIRANYGEIPYSDKYLRFLVEELKPFIDAHYQTDPGSASIAGSSMGGLISLYALCRYPEVFKRAACVSIHWPVLTKVNDPVLFHNFSRWLEVNLPKNGNQVIYLDQGTETLDSLYTPYMREIRAVFNRSAFPPDKYTIKVYKGAAHDERSWSKRFPLVLQYLFKP